jgi:hypothetical protein
MLKMNLLFHHLKQIDTVEGLGKVLLLFQYQVLASQVNMLGTTFTVLEVIPSLLPLKVIVGDTCTDPSS